MATKFTAKPDELSKLDYKPPKKGWMDNPVEFKENTFCWGAKGKNLKIIDFPNARDWSPAEEDWKLPENWQEIVLEGIKERLSKYRSLRLFMDICVRCGACADKCHFFIGSGDPKNMPVLRAELLRSIYRRYFTASGKMLGKIAGARELTIDVLKELWYYYYQCTECRRCSVFCPYGIDQAEITMMGRELLNLLGLNIDWIAGPVANCYMKGNHLGLEPHTIKNGIEFFLDDIETVTGIKIKPTFNRKGAEILFVTPSGDLFADPGTYTCMGYLMLFHELGLDYTWSTYASEGGNFGFFTSNEMAKRLNAKIYAEAKRLGVKWIIGGECGHMWRVVHQYMDTWNGPADFLEEPVSPITGTKFENAKSTKMVHIAEFTADLIKNGKLKLDPSRNDHLKVTWHDSCNTARGMGILEEPRYVLRNVCNHFYEMPEETIRERTFCCGSGTGLNASENMELRMRGGFARANAVKYVRDRYGVNMLANICAIDRATLKALMEYWAPDVQVAGLHELVANALVMKGEKERTQDLRLEPLPGKEAKE
ncbi:MAG: menaquinol oxidoreductase [Nitrospirae bacterium CG_4_10_14_3_um_filter_44_29]|nr:(Fe-S)-binding protein [Nitrospirota bacterium]OIO29790.1 MAG: menaquinol oxidoreductase [Nitrospirae bacterium CG1_02_44_142]PIP70251.1 MAG: menaquinol oxidoreductase [Nitrospirae bacterium CG22_combo_CG10-13_8_21_14_all_44_11]PIV39954.1 MAG: menaquinol oxidoreductase [Nitrospirae bacterium CG02_land_8_20_14_3_00_44_33]PIV66468.1 MAG: menaquinol oxidoreductase [Nitrospirae bacterium CG01_land_8_20_14_3_00_44_22]PIW88691.1 MAG: menaquinol oxidoreductase [Nitrospirae bacterium CG_4_8_14_3_um